MRWLFRLLAYTTDVAAPSGFEPRRLEARGAATALKVSSNVAPLHRIDLQAASAMALGSHLQSVDSTANTSVALQTIGGGSGYATALQLQNSSVLVSIDTGSSDTWVASSDLQCVDMNGNAVPPSYCQFGPLYSGGYQEGPLEGQNFNVSYGSGEFVTGTVGYSDLTVAGVNIKHQEIALVNRAYWLGDRQTSGLMGLAFPALTSSFSGNDPSQDNPKTNRIAYNPIIQSGMDQGLFSMFSMALERGVNGVWGYLAFGGLPPVPMTHKFVSTPILLTNLSAVGRGERVYSFYTIRPDGFSVFGGLLSGVRFWRPFTATSFPVIVDSGTTLNYLPFNVANPIAALFNPPAEYNPYLGGYQVDCQAKTPNVAVRINGVDLPINGADLIVQAVTVTGQNLCITTIQPTSEGPYILGDAFLKNVIAVFDIGAAQMRFASRPYY